MSINNVDQTILTSGESEQTIENENSSPISRGLVKNLCKKFSEFHNKEKKMKKCQSVNFLSDIGPSISSTIDCPSCLHKMSKLSKSLVMSELLNDITNSSSEQMHVETENDEERNIFEYIDIKSKIKQFDSNSPLRVASRRKHSVHAAPDRLSSSPVLCCARRGPNRERDALNESFNSGVSNASATTATTSNDDTYSSFSLSSNRNTTTTSEVKPSDEPKINMYRKSKKFSVDKNDEKKFEENYENMMMIFNDLKEDNECLELILNDALLKVKETFQFLNDIFSISSNFNSRRSSYFDRLLPSDLNADKERLDECEKAQTDETSEQMNLSQETSRHADLINNCNINSKGSKFIRHKF